MKRIIILIAFACSLALVGNSQIAMTNPNGFAIDTVNNTTVEGPIITINSFKSTASFSITFTKISGTVAGTVQLAGSNRLDGNYALLGSAKTNTDVASQTWSFDDSPKKYKYYKLIITPTGTMSASYRATEYDTRQ